MGLKFNTWMCPHCPFEHPDRDAYVRHKLACLYRSMTVPLALQTIRYKASISQTTMLSFGHGDERSG